MTNEQKAFITKTMAKLEITENEALDLWKFDHDQGDAPIEVLTLEQKLEKKAKSPINKVKNLKAKKKEDVYKETIIERVHGWLEEVEKIGTIAINVQKVSSTKFVFKDLNGDFYTLAVTKNKKMPDGYKED